MSFLPTLTGRDVNHTGGGGGEGGGGMGGGGGGGDGSDGGCNPGAGW